MTYIVRHLLFICYSQERIDHGELIRWTKGFGAPNTEGKDVAAMFRQSMEKLVRAHDPSIYSPTDRAAL